MKKILAVFIVGITCPGYGRERHTTARFIDDGVEVIQNGIHPSGPLEGPAGFTLTGLYAIDTGGKEAAVAGLAKIVMFEVADGGNLHILSRKSGPDMIFQYDEGGRFRLSFGRRGQGPGELQMPGRMACVEAGLLVTDQAVRAVLFDGNGSSAKEFEAKNAKSIAYLLTEGRMLSFAPTVDPSGGSMELSPELLDRDFLVINKLGGFSYPNSYTADRVDAINPFFLWRGGGGRIAVAAEKLGYEVRGFDDGARSSERSARPTIRFRSQLRSKRTSRPGGQKTYTSSWSSWTSSRPFRAW
jgi:hypothetical protein